MHDRNTLPAASPLVRRQGRHAWEFRFLLQEIVFKAKNTEDLKHLLEKELYSSPEYQDLPKFRIIGLSDYLAGLLDSIARMRGLSAPEIALDMPKSRPHREKLSKKIEALKNEHANPTATTREVPAWASGVRKLDALIEQADGSEQPPRRNAIPPKAPVVEKKRVVREEPTAVSRQDPRRETKAPETEPPLIPPHRVIGGQRRTFRRRLR